MRHPTIVSAAVLSVLAGSAAAQFANGTGAIVKVWADNCLECHGQEAQGEPGKVKSLLIDDWRNPAMDRPYFDAVKNGVKGVENHAFGERFKDPQSWALVAYIREMQLADYRKRHADPKPDAAGVYTSQRAKFKIEPVIEKDLTIPWAVDFLPDGRMLVTERSGNLRLHSSGKAGGLLSPIFEGTPKVRVRGQGGLMDVVVHPDYAKNGWIYLTYSDEIVKDGKSLGMTKIVRGKMKVVNGSFKWVDQETIFEAKPEHYLPTDIHFGSRIAFDPHDSGIMYFSIGERGHQEFAQDLKRPNGKIYRVTDSGKIPSDNPFNTPEQIASGVYGAIWSLGHRNPQGLAFDLDGNLWDTEHAPRGGDEFNLVLKAKNYGWPTVSFGMNYNGEPWQTPWPEVSKPGDAKAAEIEMPKDRWLPSIGASGLTVVRVPAKGGGGFPEWSGDMIAGGLSGNNVDRLRYKDGKVVEHEELLHSGQQRVRAVKCGPDGSIYVVYNEPANTVVRLVPVK